MRRAACCWASGSTAAIWRMCLRPDMKVALFGKVEWDSYSGGLTMMHPEYEILSGDEDGDASLHTGRVVPIYEAAGKVTHAHSAQSAAPDSGNPRSHADDPCPRTFCAQLKLPDRWSAIRALHFPPPDSDLRLLNAFRSPAQYRLIFEEFFWLECGLELKRAKARLYPGIAFELTSRVREQIIKMLPFKPTGAQKRVLEEIADDMAEPHPMYRLLQGDVGSGKTLVAAEAAIIAIENGYQVAVLAPTEILATQHYFYFKKLFQKLEYVDDSADRLEYGAREGAASQAGGARAGARSWWERMRCSNRMSSSTSWAWRSSMSSIASAWSSGRS